MVNSLKLLVGEWVGCFFHRFLPKAWNITLDSYQQSFKDLPRSLKMNDRWPPTEFVYFWQKSIISFPKMTSQQPHYLLRLKVWWPLLLLYLTKQYIAKYTAAIHIKLCYCKDQNHLRTWMNEFNLESIAVKCKKKIAFLNVNFFLLKTA